MYAKLPNLVLGFHGCNKEVYDRVIHKREPLKASTNFYDWLGNGIYFWEQNPTRAMEWAVHRYGEENAAVVGAVIDLGRCLNLTDSASAEVLRAGYDLLELRCQQAGIPIPANRKSSRTKDILLRDLDCAVIQQIHDYKQIAEEEPFDSVRGIFTEGDYVYPGSAFQEKTHVQLCICNPNCIKGYFSPLEPNENYAMP